MEDQREDMNIDFKHTGSSHVFEAEKDRTQVEQVFSGDEETEAGLQARGNK